MLRAMNALMNAMKSPALVIVLIGFALVLALFFGWRIADAPSDVIANEVAAPAVRANSTVAPVVAITDGSAVKPQPATVTEDAGEGLPSNEKLSKFLNGEIESSKDKPAR
jgi:hypothetical protein